MQSDSSSGQQSSGSQSQQQQQGSQQQREQTPEGPEENGGQQEDKPQDGDGRPDSPLESNQQDPQNRNGSLPPDQPTEHSANPIDAGEQWGDLPQHVREVFRAEGSGDMPARYRDWIDQYYRRLNDTK